MLSGEDIVVEPRDTARSCVGESTEVLQLRGDSSWMSATASNASRGAIALVQGPVGPVLATWHTSPLMCDGRADRALETADSTPVVVPAERRRQSAG